MMTDYEKMFLVVFLPEQAEQEQIEYPSATTFPLIPYYPSDATSIGDYSSHGKQVQAERVLLPASISFVYAFDVI